MKAVSACTIGTRPLGHGAVAEEDVEIDVLQVALLAEVRWAVGVLLLDALRTLGHEPLDGPGKHLLELLSVQLPP